MKQTEFNIWKIRDANFLCCRQLLHGKPFVYLDSAATTQKPQCVIQAMSEFYSNQNATVHRSVYDFASEATTRYQGVRQKMRKLSTQLSRRDHFY